MFWHFFFKPKPKWIRYGKIIRSEYITRNNHQYFIEVAKFKTYQKALSYTYKVVSDISEYDTVLGSKADLYDWTSTILRFADTTIEIRNIRPECKIVVAQSMKACSIEDLELDNPTLNFK